MPTFVAVLTATNSPSSRCSRTPGCRQPVGNRTELDLCRRVVWFDDKQGCKVSVCGLQLLQLAKRLRSSVERLDVVRLRGEHLCRVSGSLGVLLQLQVAQRTIV